MQGVDKKNLKNFGTGILFILPNIIGFLAFTTIPLVISLGMAFTNWNLQMHNMFQNQKVKFIGFDNFVQLFSDPNFFTYLGNTLFFMIGIPFGIAGSLGAALLLNQELKSGSKKIFTLVLVTIVMVVGCMLLVALGMAGSAMTILLCSVVGATLISGSLGGQTIYRTLFYFPSFTSGVATYILWKKMYNPKVGPINVVLQKILDSLTPIAHKVSSSSAIILVIILTLILGAFFGFFVWRIIKKWRDGELGTMSLLIAYLTLLIPMLANLYYSPIRLCVIMTMIFILGSLLLLVIMVNKKSNFKCKIDYALSDAIIINGFFLIILFALIGLIQVVYDLPHLDKVDGFLAPRWLSDYYWAKPAIMIMGFWAAIGSNNMLLYLAGLSGISKELYEAVDIDGANSWQRFWHITWPQLSNVTFFILIMSIMGGLQGGFETAKVMTNGGPAGSTTTLAYYVYSEGFATGRLGYASAVAWTLFALVFCVTLFNWKFGNRYTND